MIAQTCDPALTALFTPLHPRVGHYEVCTTTEPVDKLIAADESSPVHYGPVEPLEPLEAFGTSGPYDRFALARLYRGRRVQVARGWRQFEDRFESITLLSPYPDASLTRLMPGTMMIRFTISRR